jgi:hypothetical protein
VLDRVQAFGSQPDMDPIEGVDVLLGRRLDDYVHDDVGPDLVAGLSLLDYRVAIGSLGSGRRGWLGSSV